MKASSIYAPISLSSTLLGDYLNRHDVAGLDSLALISRPQDHYIISGRQNVLPIRKYQSSVIKFISSIFRKWFPKKPVDVSHIRPEIKQVSIQIEDHFRDDLKIYHHIKIVYLYLAEKAVALWNSLSFEDKGKYTRKSGIIFNGELPFKFIRYFVGQAFELDGIFGILYEGERFHEEALEWYANLLTKTPPDPRQVERQLENLWPSLSNIDDAKNLFNKVAIIAIKQWMFLSLELKKQLLEQEPAPALGELPKIFLEPFVEKLHLFVKEQDSSGKGIEHIRRYARVLIQVDISEPDIPRQGFDAVKNRATYLLKVWESLPAIIQREEFGSEGEEGLPPSFIQFMHSQSIYFGVDPAVLLGRSKKPWSYNPQSRSQIVWQGIKLEQAMQAMIEENEELAYYPQFLELRTRALIHAWVNLPSVEKKRCREENEKMGRAIDLYAIPKSFITPWHVNNFGLSELIEKNDSKTNKNNPPSGGGTTSSPSGSINRFTALGPTSGILGRGNNFSPHTINSVANPRLGIPVPIFRSALTMARGYQNFRFLRIMPAFAL